MIKRVYLSASCSCIDGDGEAIKLERSSSGWLVEYHNMKVKASCIYAEGDTASRFMRLHIGAGEGGASCSIMVENTRGLLSGSEQSPILEAS